jgi:outer membrane protein
MKKLLSIMLFFFIFISTRGLAADAIKIGIVDMNQVMQKSPLMISLNDDLAKKFKSRQDEINTANQKLQDSLSTLNTTTNLSTDERSKLQNKILTDKANIQILTASFERDVAIAKDQSIQKFMGKLTNVISKIAKDGNFDLIEQQTNMLYVNNKINITSDVLKEMT